jgi:hypothetical protein
LIELLNRSPLFERAFIVNGGPGDPASAGDFLSQAPAPVIDLNEAMNGLDVVIELSAQLDAEWGRQFVAKGGRIVSMHVASDFIIDAERMIYDLDPALLMAPTPYAEVWTLPAFAKTCASYYASAQRARVRVMPHLWNATLLERAAAARDTRCFEYEAGRARWRLAILEPNICTVKTCHLPLLLCDVAHRLNPDAIESLRVFNALRLKDHPEFVAYARSMDLVQQGLATFDGRFPIFEILGRECDAVVSHQWENAQNYLYYEALHGGFPLIHNSDLLGDCGYRYRDFDPADGALALLQALAEHDRNLEAYRAQAQAFLSGLDPCRDDNIATFSTAIAGLYDAKRPA